MPPERGTAAGGGGGGGGSSSGDRGAARRKKEVAMAMQHTDVQTFTLDHFVQGVVEWDIFGELHAEANGDRRARHETIRFDTVRCKLFISRYDKDFYLAIR